MLFMVKTYSGLTYGYTSRMSSDIWHVFLLSIKNWLSDVNEPNLSQLLYYTIWYMVSYMVRTAVLRSTRIYHCHIEIISINEDTIHYVMEIREFYIEFHRISRTPSNF